MAKNNGYNIIKSIKIGDIATVILALCVAVFFIAGAKPKDGNAKKLLLISGDQSIPLSWKDNTFNIYEMTGKRMIIEIKDGKARVLSSNCPDKLCVHTGWVFDCGHIAACLPNGVALLVDCRGDLNVTDTIVSE